MAYDILCEGWSYRECVISFEIFLVFLTSGHLGIKLSTKSLETLSKGAALKFHVLGAEVLLGVQKVIILSACSRQRA